MCANPFFRSYPSVWLSVASRTVTVSETDGQNYNYNHYYTTSNVISATQGHSKLFAAI